MAGTTGFFTRGLAPGPLRRFAEPLAGAIMGGQRGAIGSRHGFGHEKGRDCFLGVVRQRREPGPAAKGLIENGLSEGGFCLCGP